MCKCARQKVHVKLGVKLKRIVHLLLLFNSHLHQCLENIYVIVLSGLPPGRCPISLSFKALHVCFNLNVCDLFRVLLLHRATCGCRAARYTIVTDPFKVYLWSQEVKMASNNVGFFCVMFSMEIKCYLSSMYFKYTIILGNANTMLLQRDQKSHPGILYIKCF